MTVESLLTRARDLGVELWFEGDRLRFRAAKGALSPAIRAELSARKAEIVGTLRADAASRHAVFAPSHSQRSLWFVHQQDPGSAAYNVSFSARIASPLDPATLAQALQALIDRHATLRTTFPFDPAGGPMQRVAGAAELALERVDVSLLDDAALRRRVEADYRRPFDLERGPVFRACLYTRAAADHVLLLVVHHIAADGWSLLRLIEELRALYQEAADEVPARLPRPQVEYSDFAVAEARMLSGVDGERLAAYWALQLAPPRAEVALPSDRPRPARKSSRGATFGFDLPVELSARLRRLAREESTTLFVVLLAAFKVLLMRYTGTRDLVVGTPTFGRDRPEYAQVVGDFVNTLPLRTRIDPDLSFRDVLARVRRTVFDALEMQAYPFSRMVERLQPKRDPSRSPMFEVLFVLQRFEQLDEFAPVLSPDAAGASIDFGGLRMQAYAIDQQEGQFDLTLQVVDQSSTLRCHFKYATDLYDRATIARLAGSFAALLSDGVDAPDCDVARLNVLPAGERDRLLVDCNATVETPVGEVYPRLFEAQVRGGGEGRVAVRVEGGEGWSYGELNRSANRVARRLVALGVGLGDLVGVCLPRSLGLMAALLGVQKSGAAYVPLDPGFPAERLGFMLADSQARVLLTAGDAAAGIELPEGMRVLDVDEVLEAVGEGGEDGQDGDLPGCARAGDAVYVIYTSGSTGRPKGVVVTHGSLVNFLQSMRREPGLGPGDVLAAVTTISFDIAGLELYLPWWVGACVELVSRETAADGTALAEHLQASGANVLQATPATWRLLLEAGWRGGRGFRAFCGGEALPRPLAEALLERTGELWNLYGPTETTIWSTLERVSAGVGPVGIGRPIDNTRVYVLGEARELVPAGVAGELWIGGDGVASGYHRRPELTAERFVEDRFSAQPGARLYRTGDLVRWNAEGRLEHLGRIDHQVKIRGYRIELGEIESVLGAHEAVRQAVVVAREAGPSDLRLVAYLVCRPGEDLTASDVRRYLRQTLPDHMIPSVVVTLESIPLTPNGKIDRLQLPDPFRNAATHAAEPPRGPTEETLGRIWCGVLGLEAVGRTDDFFEVGGHSLLATQLTARMRETFGRAIALRAVFDHPKLHDLAEAIDTAQADDSTGSQAIEPVADGPSELSFDQERMWLLHELDPGSAAYNVPAGLWLAGDLDSGALGRALDRLVSRHEVLRTTFRVRDGRPLQVVGAFQPRDVEVRDLRSLGTEQAREHALAAARDAAAASVNLADGPVFRALLWRTGDAEHLLLLVVHHIAADQWSYGVLGRELAECYGAFARGEEPRLPESGVRFRDFAAWQRKRFSGEALAGHVGYWRGQLAGVKPLLLPSDRPRQAILASGAAWHCEPLPAALLGELEAFGRSHGSTLFMTLFAAYAVLLRRHTGQDDITVAVPIANREHRQTEALVGSFVNTLVMRAVCRSDMSFVELLGQVRTTALDAYAHQALPFAKLVEELHPVRGPAVPPLAQVLFSLQNAPMTGIEFPGLSWEPAVIERGAAPLEFGLYVDAVLSRTALFEYATELFDAGSVALMAARYVRLLRSIVREPAQGVDRLPMLNEDDERRLLVDCNATVETPVGEVYPRLFEAQVRGGGEGRVAVRVEGGEGWSYGELNRSANRVARRLVALGVGSGDLVGVCLPRSLGLMAALLGVQKSGAAYVPLDPGFPAERLGFMLADSQARVLLTAGDAAAGIELPEGMRVLDVDEVLEAVGKGGEDGQDGDLPGCARAGDAVYVIYTSGSTGRPKGVVVTHGSLVNFLQSMRREPGLGPGDVLAAVTTISFDIAGLELYLPWWVGACVELVSRETAADGTALAEHLQASGANVLQATPATWRLLLEAGWRGGRGFRAFCGGEALPRPLADALLERTGELWNLYGPTETTIWSTLERVSAGVGPVGIGRPIDNTRVYVLGEARELVPAGVAGELWIGGDGVASGYHRRPELTAERFVEDPFSAQPGARLYRTGDLVRWNAEGRLEHLGRIDHQVKIRGYRIELGEIESVLGAHEAVRQAVVVAREAGPSDLRLVAYLVCRPGEDLTASDVRRYLRQTLPDHMIPSVVVTLESIPLTPNGKIDRLQLPDPFRNAATHAAEHEPPAAGAEQALARIWQEVLQIDRVGAQANFFEMGGHSLLALRVVARVEKSFGRRVDPRTLFFQNLRQMASTLPLPVE